MNILVREVVDSDFVKIEELIQQHFEFDFKKFDKSVDLAWPRKLGASHVKEVLSKGGCAFVALVNNEIVGFILGAGLPNNPMRNVGKSCELIALFVVEAFRNSGAGSALFKSFQLWCQENNFKHLRLEVYSDNDSAVKFYKKNGFREFSFTMEQDL